MTLYNNPIADMPGPQFLILYGLIALTICFIAWRFVLWARREHTIAPDGRTPSPDPYLVAYLRDGEDEVIRVALLSLIQKGVLEVSARSKFLSTSYTLERTGKPEGEPLTDAEKAVLDAVSPTGSSQVDVRSPKVLEAVQLLCGAFQRQLEEQGLLTATACRTAAREVLPLPAIILLALAGYKIWMAIENGRYTFIFLILLGLASLGILYIICSTPRITQAGVAYLESLKQQVGYVPDGTPSPVSSGTVLLMVSLFGLTAVEHAAGYSDVHAYFEHERLASGSSWTATSGGCGGGGCGGGGCGGGGCGGCGGCG